MESEYLVVFCTCPPDAARKLTEMLLARRLAACVNCIPGIESSFWWRGHIQHDQEALLVIKTRRDRFPALSAAIAENHPYDVPEIIALPVVQGTKDYLRWIDDSMDETPGLTEQESAPNND
ncbi:MAG: divalent-cation tolerance protein CutA [Gammaproteobacteria bacterium]|nr:MAG: divalent-cation tolerance protein CutA [Gammaproteobacteria bacterium]